jgi:hypothetical protein
VLVRTLILFTLAGVCVWQQHQLRAQERLIVDLCQGLRVALVELNDAAFEVPPPPNIPRDEALHNLQFPREQ